MKKCVLVVGVVVLVLSLKLYMRSLSASGNKPDLLPSAGLGESPRIEHSTEANPSTNTETVSSLLKRLSQIASVIDTQRDTLASLKAHLNEPDLTMWKLRVLVHASDDVLPLIRSYILSAQEPLTGRLLLIFALAQPQKASILDVLTEVICSSGSEKASIAACLTFGASGANGIGIAWGSLMTKLPLIMGSNTYYRGEVEPFVPSNHTEWPDMFRSTVGAMDITMVGTAMVGLMRTSNFQVFRGEILELAWQIAQRPNSSDDQRASVREIASSSYLNQDDAWSEGLEILTHPRLGCNATDIEVVGRGLQHLDAKYQGLVLDRLAAVAPKALFEGTVGVYLPRVVEYLSKSETDGGADSRSMGQLTWTLLVDSNSPDWIMQSLTTHPSLLLRRRCANTLETFTRAGSIASERASRVVRCGKALLNDSDFQVRALAATTLVSLLNKRQPVLDGGVSSEVSQEVRQWIQRQSYLNLSQAESETVKKIANQIK